MEERIEQIEFSEKPHVSEIVPVSSTKQLELEMERERKRQAELDALPKPHDFYEVNPIINFGFVYTSKSSRLFGLYSKENLLKKLIF